MALKIAPDDRDVIWNCGQILTEIGALEDALEVYKNFSQKHSDDIAVKEMIARLQNCLRENNAMTSKTACKEDCETSIG